MGMRWSDIALDKYFAPDMSKFTAATIRDMSQTSAEQEHWLANFTLNSILRASAKPPVRAQFFNFLRRTHAAFDAYGRARESSLAYLRGPERHPLRYLEAIDHWEAFLGNAYQALLFLSARGWFEPDDGSVPQRLNHLYNWSKHSSEKIAQGLHAEEAPLCLWLTNPGLRNAGTVITFDEMAQTLSFLADWADAVQDPLTAREKLTAMQAKHDAEGAL